MIPLRQETFAPWRVHAAIAHGFGVAALFSGVALLAHILTRIPLRLMLSLTIALMMIAVNAMWRRCGPKLRALLVRYTMVGLFSGLLGTAGYDMSKFALTRWGSYSYNPFEVIRIFGVLLAGSSAPVGIIYAAGAAFHVLNGASFGIAFCFPFGRRGIVPGMAWAFCLETLQLTLYPGWLDIRAYQEFAQISAFSHLVYGSILGWCCQRGLRRWGAQLP